MSEELTALELVEMIKNPTGEAPEARGACKLMQTIRTLPPAYQEALAMTMHDESVTHPEVVSFINNHTDAHVSLSAVQRHRNKRGCLVCLYGEAK